MNDKNGKILLLNGKIMSQLLEI